MTVLWPNDSLTFTFYVIISNSIPNQATFVKEVFDSMFSLESVKMTALWPNDILTFTFIMIVSNSIPSWVNFEKEIFYSMFSSESDKMTAKLQLNFHFLCGNLK